jgi:hypothetical protein
MSERAGATVSETPGSHAVYVSRPAVVAAVIAQAAESLGGRFVPDVGETQGELIDKFPGSEVLPVSVPVPYTKPDGTTGTDLYLSKGGQAAFAADVSTATFRLRQATQRPFDADSFIYPTQAAAWRTIPSWGLVAGRDKAIPPAAERWMYGRANFRKVVEVPTSSHVARISHPKATAKLIEGAARATR